MASLNDLYAHLKTLCEQWFYNKSTSDDRFATKSHGHGNVTNDGKIGSTANKPVITGTGGVVTTGSFGTSANTFCQGNDSRLSDARTPKSHAHGNISNDGKVTTANNSPSKLVVTDNNGVVAVATGIDASLVRYTSQETVDDSITALYNEVSELKNVHMIKYIARNPNELPRNALKRLVGDASSSTMDKIYAVVNLALDSDNDNMYDLYITVYNEADKTYSWEKIDDGNVQSFLTKTSGDLLYAPISHNHTSTEVTVQSQFNNLGKTNNQPITLEALLGLMNTAVGNKSATTHAHGNLLSGGTITATGNFKDYIAIVDKDNKLTKATAIDVLDNIVQQLITYGAS